MISARRRLRDSRLKTASRAWVYSGGWVSSSVDQAPGGGFGAQGGSNSAVVGVRDTSAYILVAVVADSGLVVADNVPVVAGGGLVVDVVAAGNGAAAVGGDPKEKITEFSFKKSLNPG